jgi:hypothetical protein
MRRHSGLRTKNPNTRLLPVPRAALEYFPASYLRNLPINRNIWLKAAAHRRAIHDQHGPALTIMAARRYQHLWRATGFDRRQPA